MSAEVINSGINGDFEKIMNLNSPIDEADGEPLVVDLTDDFDEEQEQSVLVKQKSQEGVVQYFDNGDQFLSTEEQQKRKFQRGNYNTQILQHPSKNNTQKITKDTFMSNITELSPNNTGSKSTTNKIYGSQNNNNNPSKSSNITTINRLDSNEQIAKHQLPKQEVPFFATDKKSQIATKKIKLVLNTNQIQNTDLNHYSASVGIPVRSFLTNSSNKINQIKNQVRTNAIDVKMQYSAEKSKMISNKSGRLQANSTYLKKFKSHQANSKLTSIQLSAQSQGSNHGIQNYGNQYCQTQHNLNEHYHNVTQSNKPNNQRKLKQKTSPIIKKYSQSDWQSIEQQKKYFSQQKIQHTVKQDRSMLATSISPKLSSDKKRENLYVQRHNIEKTKFSSTQIYISKVKCLAPQSVNSNQSIPRQQPGFNNQLKIQQTQHNRLNQNRNSTLVGPMRNATISLVYLEKFGSKKSIGNLVIGSLANKFKNINKLSVKSNNSINSRFNVAQAVIGNDKRPQNNPFTDIQSFSSNGLGQILGISFKKLGGNNSKQAAKCLGDSPNQLNNQIDKYGPKVMIEYEDQPVQVEDYEMLDEEEEQIHKSIQNDSFEKGSMCSNMSEHKNHDTSNLNPAKHYLQTSSDIVCAINQPQKQQDMKQLKNQQIRQSNIFLSYKSLANKKGSLQNQFAPLKTHDPHQFKNALSSHLKGISKPYISTQGHQPLLNKSITQQSSTNLNSSKGHGQKGNISTGGLNTYNSKRNSIAVPLTSVTNNKPSILFHGQQKAEQKITRVLKTQAPENEAKFQGSADKKSEKHKFLQVANYHTQKQSSKQDQLAGQFLKQKINKNQFEITDDDFNQSKHLKLNYVQKKEAEIKINKGQSNQKSQAQIFQSAVVSGTSSMLSPKPKLKKKGNQNLNKAIIQSNMITSVESSFANTNQAAQQTIKNNQSLQKTLFNKIQQQEQYQLPLTQRNMVLIDLEQPVDQFTKQQSQKRAMELSQQASVPSSNPTVKKLNDLSSNEMTSALSVKQQPSSAMALPHYPMAADQAIQYFSNVLNDYEKQEIYKFDKHIYYVGQNCKKKIKGHCNAPGKSAEFIQRHKDRLKQMNIFNHGYDDEQGDYQVILKDHLGYRFEVLEFLGQGSFGQAIKCLDHKTQQKVAIKIIRNKKKFQYQAGIELKTLKYLNMHDKYDQNNIIRVKDFMVFRKHLLIAFECLSINLYEFIKNNNFQGVHQNLIRRFAIQILQALKFQRDHGIVHCDLKPENILLKQENKSGIKIIDYGSSCFIGQRIYTYIQSRFYRAPEIILGIPYTMAIDMWSFGCIIAELFTGYPIFPGENEVDQLAFIMEICGVPTNRVLQISSRRHLFFDESNQPILMPNSKGKIRHPNAKTLVQVLLRSRPRNKSSCYETEGDNKKFIDFLERCFEWHPEKRMTPLEALHHDWILEGLPDDVLEHHLKMFEYSGEPQETQTQGGKLTKDIREDNSMIRQATYQEIQGFPPNAQTKSIYEIVGEIRREDQEREKRKLQRERKHREDQAEKDRFSKEIIDQNYKKGALIINKQQAQPQDAETKAISSSTSFNKLNQPLKSSTFKATKKFSQTQPSSSYTGILHDPDLPQQNSVVQYSSPQKQRLTLQKKSEQIPFQSQHDHQFQTEQRHVEKIDLLMSNNAKRIQKCTEDNEYQKKGISERQYQSTSKKMQHIKSIIDHPEAHNEYDVEVQRIEDYELEEGDADEEDGEDTIEDDLVELSRIQVNSSTSFPQANYGSQKNNQSKRGEMISQRMELQSRIIKDQVFGQQQSPTQNFGNGNLDNKQDDAESITIYRSRQVPANQDKKCEDKKIINSNLDGNLDYEQKHHSYNQHQSKQDICSSSSSSDMMMDMSECPGVNISSAKDINKANHQKSPNFIKKLDIQYQQQIQYINKLV